MKQNIIKNIIYTVLFSVIPLFTAITMTFMLTRILPGDPVLQYLMALGNFSPTPSEIADASHLLGFDQPVIIQFIRFLIDMVTGNFGYTILAPVTPISQFLIVRIPISLSFTIIPICLGLVIGIFLGILSVKIRYKFVKIIFQILIILGISMPVFFVGMCFQYVLSYQLDLFPMIGDPFLPSCILLLSTISLTTRQVRSNYLKGSEEKQITSHNLQILGNISILIVIIFLLETTFGLSGFFTLIIDAMRNLDFWVIRATIFIFIILIVVILFLSNTIYTLYNLFLEKRKSSIFAKSEQILEESARYSVDSDQKFKEFIVYRLKSPLAIIGLIIVAFSIIVAIFPQILTPLTYNEATGIFLGAWDPPSGTHLLGQGKFGRDVLALLVYGVKTSLAVCIIPILIGCVIGTGFGYLCKINKWVKEVVIGLMVITIIIPSIFVIMINSVIYGREISSIISVMAMYMIPTFTLIVSKGNYSVKLTAKKLIMYLPLFMAFNILLFESLGFLGFSDPILGAQLGTNISIARPYYILAPWASYWASLALNIMVIGFFSLYYGLKEPIPIEFRKTSKF